MPATAAHAITAPPVAPVTAFARLAQHPGAFWLDSSLQRLPDARYSIMSCDPRWVFTSRRGKWRLDRRDGHVEEGASDPLRVLDGLLDARQALVPDVCPELPFCGGAVGWLSYDLGRQFESFNGTAVDDLDMPDIWLGWYDAAVVWDLAAGSSWIVGIRGERNAEHAVAALADLIAGRPTEPAMPGPPNSAHALLTTNPLPALRPVIASSDMSRAGYMSRVAEVREGIARGEYYQLNLVQRFECPQQELASTTYLRLRETNPAPFSAYVNTGECAILSSSPERFLEISPTGQIGTCPIKGTRPRLSAAEDDAKQRRELLNSAKERAELLMIVDLLRNDLGRICVPGSVDVRRLHALESFATVHHLVGEVRGQLRPGLSRRDVLRAVFPGGSITGAPKVSAMATIDRLEPHRRGIGMGALGYFSAHGRTDLSIAIRTIVCRGGTAYVPVGAGIVWDSDPGAEYEETLAKARALFAALGVAGIAP